MEDATRQTREFGVQSNQNLRSVKIHCTAFPMAESYLLQEAIFDVCS